MIVGRNHMLSALCFMLLSCTTQTSSKSDLNFYGFNIGDSLKKATANMKERAIRLFDNEQASVALYKGQAFTLGADRCVDTGLKAPKAAIYTCQIMSPLKPDKGGIPFDFNLYFVDDTLVKIEARFEAQYAKEAAQSVSDKYGSSEENNWPDGYRRMLKEIKENSFMRENGTAGTFISPYGLEECNDGCVTSALKTKKPMYAIFIRRNAGLLNVLTIMDTDLMRKSLGKLEAEMKEAGKEQHQTF